MANPFTSVTVSNYNLNPPPDDGSEVPANEIKWATHKTKIGDPLKTALESINTNTLAAFGKVAGGITSVSDDYTVLASDQGKVIKATVAGKTITSPAAATVGAAFRFAILNNSSGDITLDPNASETIDGLSTLTIPKTRGLIIDTDGANWFSTGVNWHPEIRPAPFSTPRGRLTLATGVPVLTSDQTAKTTVYFTPYQGNTVMLPDANGDWAIFEFSELSQALSDNTKSPAAAGSSSLYDMFVWSDSGTIRCTRGPAWSSATSRGTGAGTTEITLLDGVYVNANAISNGPGASRGVYVGTISTDGSTQLNMQFAPSAAAGGSNNRLDIWNAYNRIAINSLCRDSTDTWSYDTATIRAANNSNSNRITFVCGLNEDAIRADYFAAFTLGSGNTGIRAAGVGLDSTSAFSGIIIPSTASAASEQACAIGTYGGVSGLGSHFVQALERGSGAGATTWQGDNGSPTFLQSGLTAILRM